MPSNWFDFELSENEVVSLIDLVNSSWTVHKFSEVSEGATPIYELVVATEDDVEPMILKVCPDAENQGMIQTEARYQELVRQETSIPVPEIYGVIDEHSELHPSCFVMEHVNGDYLGDRKEFGDNEDVYEQVAYQIGQYLGELHNIPLDMDGFGLTQFNVTDPLNGSIPNPNPGELVIRDGESVWGELFVELFETNLDAIRGTTFCRYINKIESMLNDSQPLLNKSFNPVIGRVDSSYSNMVVDRSTGEIQSIFDWNSQRVTPRCYSLFNAQYLLSYGGWWLFPDVPDLSSIVKPALLEGYQEYQEVPDSYDDLFDLYQLNWLLLEMKAVDNGRGDGGGGPSNAVLASNAKIELETILSRNET